MKAVRVHEYGGPDRLVVENIQTPEPGPGEALVRLEAIGVNFIDVYHRSGLYPGELPFTPGMEGAGTVAAVGPGVEHLQQGTRVAYAMVRGSYAEYAVVPADRLVPLPDDVSTRVAAAVMLQGMTAHFLANATVELTPESVCLIHAAAGGVGLLLIQMAKMRGATVIGTVSTKEKEKLAREAGADHVIRYTEHDFVDEVKRLTAGQGVHVVYDSVGRATFNGSLDCLRPRGTLVLYGQSSGPVEPIDPQILNVKGSLYLTRPSLSHYAADRKELLDRANDLFNWLRDGTLKVRIDCTLPLEEARKAHELLAGRQTTGKLVLLP